MEQKASLTVYDKEDVYRNKIEPLVKEIEKLCTVHGIPTFMTFCIKNDKESVYKNAGVVPNSVRTVLADDRISKHLLVCVGFEPTYHAVSEFDEVETDEILSKADSILEDCPSAEKET